MFLYYIEVRITDVRFLVLFWLRYKYFEKLGCYNKVDGWIFLICV